MNRIKRILPIPFIITLALCSNNTSLASNSITTPERTTLELNCSSGCNGDTSIRMDSNDTLSIEIILPVYPIEWNYSLNDSLFLIPINDTIIDIPNRIGIQIMNLQFLCPSPGIDTLILSSKNSMNDSLMSQYMIEMKIR